MGKSAFVPCYQHTLVQHQQWKQTKNTIPRKPENVVTSLSRLDIIVLATRMQDLCNNLKS